MQKKIPIELIIAVAIYISSPLAMAAEGHADLNGIWIINEELSDDTDAQVEKAIKAAGGKIKRNGKKGKERYRGGPQEEELYDRISYDGVLQIQYTAPEFRFIYADGFQRLFYSDGRGRTASATGKSSDYSFADWEGETLLVESRPRDGGWTNETYALEQDGQQLRVELELKPLSFGASIRIVRIYDRNREINH